jgi:hypothetical protein
MCAFHCVVAIAMCGVLGCHDKGSDSNGGSEAESVTLAGDDRIFECEGGRRTSVVPDPGEEHRWLGVRLKPNPQRTFVPAELTYAMDGGTAPNGSGAICHSNYAHAIMIWTQPRTDDTPVPPASPYVIAVPADTGPDDDVENERTADLDGSGIVANPGEDLFVAIQLNGQYPNVSCPRVCAYYDQVYPPGHVLWFSALEGAPFNFYDYTGILPGAGLDYVVAGSYE